MSVVSVYITVKAHSEGVLTGGVLFKSRVRGNAFKKPPCNKDDSYPRGHLQLLGTDCSVPVSLFCHAECKSQPRPKALLL